MNEVTHRDLQELRDDLRANIERLDRAVDRLEDRIDAERSARKSTDTELQEGLDDLAGE